MKRWKSPAPLKLVKNTISYFGFFGFPPTFEEIFTFFPCRISKKGLNNLLHRLIRQKKLITSNTNPVLFHRRERPTGVGSILDYPDNAYNKSALPNKTLFNYPLYTLPQYSIFFKNRASRQAITINKLNHVAPYLKALSSIPFILLVGISGSASMGNCRKNDDVDLFVVTRRKCLFTGRFWAIFLAVIFRLRKGPHSVCLNLFFDESNLATPENKRTNYVAHEILQMKPVINKNNTYVRLLKANDWIYKIYPNARRLNPHAGKNRRTAIFTAGITILMQPLELLFKMIQLAVISKNKTGYLLSPTQLWLFKKDFEQKIRKQV